jgi:hypothetical protein
MHDSKGRVHNPQNGSGNYEECEGGASSDGGHQSTVKDLPNPSGCVRKPVYETQGLE